MATEIGILSSDRHEQQREQKKQYRKENPERCQESSRKSYRKHRATRIKRMKTYYRRYYEENRERILESNRRRTKARTQEIRNILVEFKLSNPCMDCGENDPVVLDFDHIIPKNKEFTISRATSHRPRYERLLNEIVKCRIVCANCHRRRTYKAGLFYVKTHGKGGKW